MLVFDMSNNCLLVCKSFVVLKEDSLYICMYEYLICFILGDRVNDFLYF